MIWLMQKNVGDLYAFGMWFTYFLVFDFIQDMEAIQSSDNLFMIIIKGNTTWNFYVNFDHSLYKDLSCMPITRSKSSIAGLLLYI
jgi:hypothetical protein